jgi:hypothetical protein
MKLKRRREPSYRWRLTPVILASWETEIRRMEVGGKPRQIVETASPK